ncbi:hypothetical protein PHLCEN_2v5543, partial [Hermanssonia centrifuga]
MSPSPQSTAPPSFEAAIFSSGKHPSPATPTEEITVEAKAKSFDDSSEKTAVSTTSSAKASPSPSIHEVDTEKAERSLADDDKALAQYLVPTLPKGVKTARKKPASLWIRFRVWYNPYRMLFTFVFTLNMVGIFLACIHHFPYAEHHGAALALGNIVSAVACRNELFLRYLFWVIVKVFQK